MSTKPKTVYLAGKITGDAGYKRKFADAGRALEEAGFIVMDPAILPDRGFEYMAYIRMTAAMLDECEAVCLLEDWRESNGARSERERAARQNKEIFEYAQWRKHHETADMAN